MRRLGLLIVVGLLSFASPAAAAKFSGSCSITPDTPGYMILTVTNPITQPGHYLAIGLSSPSGAANPDLIRFGPGTTQAVVAYSGAGTYKAIAEEVVDKTGNGSGDGSGDKYTVLSLDLCGAVLP